MCIRDRRRSSCLTHSLNSQQEKLPHQIWSQRLEKIPTNPVCFPNKNKQIFKYSYPTKIQVDFEHRHRIIIVFCVHIIMIKIISFIEGEKCFMHCQRTVSYTHLDVYKRQEMIIPLSSNE